MLPQVSFLIEGLLKLKYPHAERQTPVITALGKLKWEDHIFEEQLRLVKCLKTEQKKNKTETFTQLNVQ